MPAFTLYGAQGSTATNRVLLTLAEGHFEDYTFVTLKLPQGEQKVSFWCLSVSRRLAVMIPVKAKS